MTTQAPTPSCHLRRDKPSRAASGLPEVIAFLNGTFQGKIFQMRTLIVKYLACLLAVGSGLPAGPEAPMIHLGAMVGRSVSSHDSPLAFMPFFKRVLARKFRLAEGFPPAAILKKSSGLTLPPLPPKKSVGSTSLRLDGGTAGESDVAWRLTGACCTDARSG